MKEASEYVPSVRIALLLRRLIKHSTIKTESFQKVNRDWEDDANRAVTVLQSETPNWLLYSSLPNKSR